MSNYNQVDENLFVRVYEPVKEDVITVQKNEPLVIKPILFSTPMVEAILEGRKTQTRRIIKSRHESGLFRVCRRVTDNTITSIESLDWDEKNCEKDIIPKYNIGDILWVRETWQKTTWLHPSDESFGFIYKASENGKEWEANDEAWKWRPSIFMPKAACRLFLKVQAVRAERLHEITGDEILREGVDNGKSNKAMGLRWENMQRMAFEKLWNKVNGNWNENPFVWVYTFKVVDKPEGF